MLKIVLAFIGALIIMEISLGMILLSTFLITGQEDFSHTGYTIIKVIVGFKIMTSVFEGFLPELKK